MGRLFTPRVLVIAAVGLGAVWLVPPASASVRQRRADVPAASKPSPNGLALTFSQEPANSNLVITGDYGISGTVTASKKKPRFNAAEARLLRHIPKAIQPHCKPVPQEGPMARGAYIDCSPGGDVESVTYIQARSVDEARSLYAGDLASAPQSQAQATGQPVQPIPQATQSQNCPSQSSGTLGQFLCWMDKNADASRVVVWIDWTDEPLKIFSTLVMKDSDVGAAYAAWNDAGPK